MNLTKLTGTLLLLGVLLPVSIFAKDLENFSSDREAFIKELGEFMQKTNNQAVIQIFKDFETYFNAGSFSKEESHVIITTSNKMLEHGIKANPYFTDYLTGLLFIKKAPNGIHVFAEWHQVIQQILGDNYKKQARNYKTYLDFSTTFFSNAALRRGDRGTAWVAQNGDYHLAYQAGQPVVILEKFDLVTIQKKNEMRIRQTGGTFFPLTKKWQGNGGRIQWTVEGVRDVYCELLNYQIKLDKGNYKIDTVQFFHERLFPGQVILGSLENKIQTGNRTTAASYPRFLSHQKRLQLDELGERIKFSGGFKMQGSTIFGYGDATQKATIELFDATGKLAFRGTGQQFKITEGKQISGASVSATLLINQDSIFHPSVDFKYHLKKFELQLAKGNKPGDQAPFYNSYQQLNIHSNKINWTVGEPELFINQKNEKIGNGNKKVSFESVNYFDVQTYRKLQNVADRNPIATLKLLSDELKSRQVAAEDYAKKMNPNFSVTNIKSLLFEMVAKGFITFDSEANLIQVNDKLIHFADAAQDQIDYDLIRYTSDSDQTNAILNTTSQDILVNDVSVVEFSDRQKVAAKPYSGQVVLQKDRNLDFDGKLFAGYSSLTGKDFHFLYQNNELQLDSVKYFDLFIPTNRKDKTGDIIADGIASRIENLSGKLLIDAPANKSGREDIPMFPSLSSEGPSYIFYDDPDTQNGSYPADSFYFKLDEFHLNGLDQLTPEAFHFKGVLISGGILPEIKEVARLQEDRSFGFSTLSPDTGFATYGEKGTFNGTVTLSNKGFTANGDISYQGATIQSDDIVMKPQQLLSTAQQFDLEESRAAGKEVPEVHGQQVNIDWQPYKDSMYVRSQDAPFKLFKSGAYTLGNLLILTPDGLKGRGVFDWEKGRMTSGLFSLGANSILADTTNLTIKASGLDHLALDTKNVYTSLDFDQQIGTVKANSDSVYTELPYNTYITSLNEFDWDMKNETITFKADENGRGSFRSTNEAHDGLTFWGKEAFYDLKSFDLKLGGVSRIETADAYVVPAEGSLEIEKMGTMKTLYDARIIADTVNQYHVIKRATVDILGRKNYKGTGFYEYNLDDRKQELRLTSIEGQPVSKKKNAKCLTTAIGSTIDTTVFYMDTKTQFKGNIELNSAEANLIFAGFARLDAERLPNKEWFSVASSGDKLDLKLSYKAPKNQQGALVKTGLYLNKFNGQLYPAIMNSLNGANDIPFFETTGLLDYSPKEDAFLMGDSLKIVSGVKNGNLLTYNNKKGNVELEGQFQMMTDEDPISTKVAGTTTFAYSEGSDETENLTLELMAGFNFFLPEKLMKIIETDIRANAFNARNIDYLKNRNFYNKALAEFIPPGKELANARARMLNMGLEMPKKYNNDQLLVTELKMKWRPDLRSFITENQRFGLATVNGEPVNKMVDGVIQYRIMPNGEKAIYLLLKTPGDSYEYYFEYNGGVMSTTSDNPAYTEAVEGLKKKEQFQKTKGGRELEIQLVQPAKAAMLRRRAQAN